jgi:alpha-ketoglutarate-dependent taurine dioxygenase
MPLVIEPAIDDIDLVAWAASNRAFIDMHLHKHGALLWRGFAMPTVAAFEQFTLAACGSSMEYRERSSPRSRVAGNIYTSTDYPPDQRIFLHNEHSYSSTFPLRILFYCQTPARQGGETPIADCRKVFARIDEGIRTRFVQRGWMYVRNFGDGFGLPWQTVFQTSDCAEVEAYCDKANISVEWKDGDRLRTRQVRPVVATHPRTGEISWFNHMTFFHVSTLPPAIRTALLTQLAEDLPNNTYYGDGSPIEPEVLDHLRGAYLQEQVMFPWQKQDILMLDNLLTAHAREPFDGPRKVLVSMAEPYTRSDL